MKHINFSLAELCMVVAVCAAAIKFAFEITPCLGDLCQIACKIVTGSL